MNKNSEKEDSKRGIARFLEALQHPGVLTALVTAIFGSLAVAIATGYVTKELGEREMQVSIVKALIEYTQKPEFIEVAPLSKLEAMAKLIDDNKDQFDINVEGFLKAINTLRFDNLSKARQAVQKLENQQEELNQKLEDGSENKISLQNRIEDNRVELSSARRNLLTAETNLKGAEDLISSLKLQIAQKQKMIDRLTPTYKRIALKEGQQISFQLIDLRLNNIGDVKNNADFSYGVQDKTVYKIENVLEGNSFAKVFPEPFNGELVVRVLSVDRQEKSVQIKLSKYPILPKLP